MEINYNLMLIQLFLSSVELARNVKTLFWFAPPCKNSLDVRAKVLNHNFNTVLTETAAKSQ